MPTNEAIETLEDRLSDIATDFEREDVDTVEGILHFRLATDYTAQQYMRPSSAVYVQNGIVQEFDIRLGGYELETARNAVSRIPHQPPHDGVVEGHGVDAPVHVRAYNIEADIETVAKFLQGMTRELGGD